MLLNNNLFYNIGRLCEITITTLDIENCRRLSMSDTFRYLSLVEDIMDHLSFPDYA